MPRPAIGCVKFLNARPLIDGLIDHDQLTVRFDVPSALLTDLESGAIDLALCPVIDYQRSEHPLSIVPVGGICCAGQTLTVRVFSRVPLERLIELHADTDSHTSVALAQVVLHHLYDVRPRVVDFDPGQLNGPHPDLPQTLLLIGDKVVTDTPPSDDYPFQLDLGEAWHEWTGLPFMFATWMARRGEVIDAAAGLLEAQRRVQRAAHRPDRRHARPAAGLAGGVGHAVPRPDVALRGGGGRTGGDATILAGRRRTGPDRPCAAAAFVRPDRVVAGKLITRWQPIAVNPWRS
jgi:chorismate dehydratase